MTGRPTRRSIITDNRNSPSAPRSRDAEPCSCQFDWAPGKRGRALRWVATCHRHPDGQGTIIALPNSDTLRDLARMGALVGQAELDAAQEPQRVCEGGRAAEGAARPTMRRDTGRSLGNRTPRPAWLRLQPSPMVCQEDYDIGGGGNLGVNRSCCFLVGVKSESGVATDSCTGLTRAARMRLAPGQSSARILLCKLVGLTKATPSFGQQGGSDPDHWILR